MEEIYGIGEVLREESTEYSLWETHESLILPLEIGWHLLDHERFQLNVHAGFGLEMSLRRTGFRWDVEAGEPMLRKLDEMPFRNRGLFQARAGLDFAYQCSNRLGFFIGFGAGTDLLNHLKSTEGLSEKYRWVNGQLGIQFKL